VRIAAGAAAVSAAPGAPRGSSEAAPIRSGGALVGIAAIEPWHGNAVVVYTRDSTGIGWRRQVLDDSLREGHALLAADFDRDGVDEVVAGWRGGSGGLALYDPIADVNGFRSVPLDKGIPVEGLAAADLDLDGRLDLVAIAGRTNHLAWYKNCCR
jgi:hypothetical protein